MASESFQERFIERAATHSPLCVGVDPSQSSLRQWGLPDDLRGLREFTTRIISLAAPRVAVIKPQCAFFERYGPDGLTELQNAVKLAKQLGALVIIDVKRGDIGSSATAYGDAFLGSDSPFGGDAVTITPYCGFGSLLPILERARARGCGVFVVVRTSNPEGSELQLAKLADGRSVVEGLADEVTSYNRATAGEAIGLAGAVLGATHAPEMNKLAARMPTSLFLVPGIGAQGAKISDVQTHFGMHYRRVLPSVSRAIAGAGPKEQDLIAKVEEFARAARGM